MEIINHYISDTEIIGIGPVLTERKQDPLYPTLRYSCWVHTRYQSIRIESDACVLGEFNPQREKDTAYLKDWLEKYQAAKEKILQLIKDKD